MKKIVMIIAGLLASVGLGRRILAQEQMLYIYGSAEPRVVQAVAATFEQVSNVAVQWTRLSAGEALIRLRDEQAAPQADVWWGGSLDPHSIAAVEELTVPYCPAGYAQLDPRFRDPLGECQVIGVYVGILGFSVNTQVLETNGLPIPQRWDDLLDPRYKGLIGMANPNSSGTAFTTLATQVFRKGEENGQKVDETAALEYMQQLHRNIAAYTTSGTEPGLMAGRGEIAIAIMFLHDAVYQAEQGYPVTPVIPADGTGYEIGGLNLIKNAPHPEIARQFMDWVISWNAQRIPAMVGAYQFPTNSAAPVPTLNVPMQTLCVVNYDAVWVANNGKRLLERWTQEVFALPR